MIISERIFKKLEEKGMTQKEFADATGITPSTISDWKRKKTNPAADKIMVICDVLEMSPYELLSGADSKYNNQLGYVIVDKNSNEYFLIEQFQGMRTSEQERLFGYLEALRQQRSNE